MIVALVNQQGGVGKTTLATHLGWEFSRSRSQVLLIDADPKESALEWADIRRQRGLTRRFGVVKLARDTLHLEVPRMAQSVHHIVIDSPPRVTGLIRAAMLASDMVLIPLQPSSYDIEGTAETMRLLREAILVRPTLKAAFVVSRKIARTTLGRELSLALRRTDLPVLETPICQRVAYAQCATRGECVHEIPRAAAAQNEMAMLAKNIWELLR